MSVAAWRIRKRIKEIDDDPTDRFVSPDFYSAIGVCLVIIDQEIEAEAERQFTKPINPDQVTEMAKEVK